MNPYKTLKKNARALSPVVASIILIAVTVAVSVVVAAWMGGMSIGMMGQAEQGSITNVAFTGAGATITVTISNTGQATMNFTNAYVNGIVIGTVAPTFATTGVLKGQAQSYVLTSAWTSGTTYTIKLTTTKANNIVNTITAP